MGSTMVPVPYMSIVTFGSAARTSRTVRDNGKNDFQLNSRALVVTGHEPGIGKGVVVAGYKSHALVRTGASDIYSEGWAEIRDGDPALINRPGPGAVENRRTFRTETIAVATGLTDTA